MGRIVGIDLGTTNSCVAVVDRGETIVIANSEGSRTTPSIVAFSDKGETLVGQMAKRQAIPNPNHTVYAVKRLVGRRFEDSYVARFREVAPFEICEAENGDAWVNVGGKLRSPEEISAIILGKMRSTAEDFLGQEVTDAVITVPAYFNDAQRQATKDAGKIAGLNVLRIINEPTAAALSYGLDQKNSEKIVVFDLGGGTFDVSILQIGEGVFQVLATHGDTFLGGEDFDERLVTYLTECFQEEHSIDLRGDPMALQRLKEAAERAKRELSSSPETDINLPFICADESGPKHLNMVLTRPKLEELVAPLIERLEEPCRAALEDAELEPSELDHILLVGGMTRMPRVQAKVEEVFGQPPHRGLGGGDRSGDSGQRPRGGHRRRAAARRHPALPGRRDSGRHHDAHHPPQHDRSHAQEPGLLDDGGQPEPGSCPRSSGGAGDRGGQSLPRPLRAGRDSARPAGRAADRSDL
jgi:molecular chaperone DnaK